MSTAPSVWVELVAELPTFTHIIFAALLPIYAASHAALRKPTNCTTDKSEDDESDEEEEEQPSHVESLSTSDAVMFPVMAGCTLAVLYGIIKILKMPELLNLLVQYYMSFFGLFAVGKMASDVSRVIVSFVFPQMWKGKQGKLFSAGFSSWKTAEGEVLEDPKPLGIPLPKFMWSSVWDLSRSLRARWTAKYRIPGMKKSETKAFWLGDIAGPFVGVATIIAYTYGGKHWTMTNILGTSFSYTALQLMSPSSFPIGSLLLGLLFVYDIVMVFYTPMMVTVATTLEAPIKLEFPRAGGRNAMLGLGDVVVPGLIIAMALRYDLWRHYEQRRIALLATSEDKSPEAQKALKPRYRNATGNWGERFFMGQHAYFDKTYFSAGMAGYIVGISTTLGVMQVFKHAQPALFYLVPSVLGAVWGTALVNGELRQMMAWTEEGEEETDDKDKDGEKKEEPEKENEEEGEVDKEYLWVRLVRKPARGAERKTKAKSESSEDLSDEESEDMSCDSSESVEVVEKP